MKKDIVRVEFTLYGDDWPVEAFTEEIGIKPTRCYKKGIHLNPILVGLKRFGVSRQRI